MIFSFENKDMIFKEMYGIEFFKCSQDFHFLSP